jgi:hypothetical protein
LITKVFSIRFDLPNSEHICAPNMQRRLPAGQR